MLYGEAAINIDELLRSDADIRDLLSAYGEATPESPKAARQRLLELVDHLGQTRIVGTLCGFAHDFARMAGEIVNFCKEKAISIGGQIQLIHDNLSLDFSSLNTGWVFGGAARWSPTLRAAPMRSLPRSMSWPNGSIPSSLSGIEF